MVVLTLRPADRQRYRADGKELGEASLVVDVFLHVSTAWTFGPTLGLVALIMDEPPGPFDFTVVSAMGAEALVSLHQRA